MIDKLNERAALGDATHDLCHKVRHIGQFAPDADRLRVGQTYRDADGQWWVIGVEQCASETEAEVLVNRLHDQ